MIFTLQGQRYEVNQERMSLQEAQRIKQATGLTVRGFLNGLKDYDPDAILALVWLAKRRAGERVTFEDVAAINFDLLQDFEAVKEPEEAEPDPTGGAAPPTMPTMNGSTSTSPQPSTPSTPTSTAPTG